MFIGSFAMLASWLDMADLQSRRVNQSGAITKDLAEECQSYKQARKAQPCKFPGCTIAPPCFHLEYWLVFCNATFSQASCFSSPFYTLLFSIIFPWHYFYLDIFFFFGLLYLFLSIVCSQLLVSFFCNFHDYSLLFQFFSFALLLHFHFFILYFNTSCFIFSVLATLLSFAYLFHMITFSPMFFILLLGFSFK